MTYTYEQLKDMTVVQLRQIAGGVQHDEVKGFSTMHKEKLLPALCTAFGIEAHVHHQVVGINKAQIKAEIRKQQLERDSALAVKDSERQRAARKQIHKLKRDLRKAMQ